MLTIICKSWATIVKEYLIYYKVNYLYRNDKTIQLNIVKIFTHFFCNMGVIETGKLSLNLAGGCVSPFLLRQAGSLTENGISFDITISEEAFGTAGILQKSKV